VPKNSVHTHRAATATPDHREFVDHCVHKALLELKNALYKALSSLPNEGWTGYTPRTALELLYPDDSQMFDVENHPVPPLAAPPADVLRRQLDDAELALRHRIRIEAGLADARVAVLDISGGMMYATEILDRIRKHFPASAKTESKAAAMAAANRVYFFDGQRLMSAADQAARRNPAPSWFTPNPRGAGSSILVVVGHARTHDLYLPRLSDSSRAVTRQARALASGSHRPGEAAESSHPGRGAKVLTTPDAYRHAYELVRYHKSIKRGDSSPPLHPGEYERLYAWRSAALAWRREALRSLVSVGRGRETVGDSLGLYPIYHLLATFLIREAGVGVASLASDASFIDAPTMGGLRRFLGRSFKQLHIANFQGDASGHALATVTMADVVLMNEPRLSRPASARRGERWGGAEFDGRFDAEVSFSELPQAGPDTGNTAAVIESRPVAPTVFNKYHFRPASAAPHYRAWMSLDAIGDFKLTSGLIEKREGVLIDIDYDRLAERMKRYLGEPGHERVNTKTHDDLKGLWKPQERFNPESTYANTDTERFDKERIVPYLYKPFDLRWCYHSRTRTLWADPKPRLEDARNAGDSFVVVRRTAAARCEGTPFYFASELGDNDLLRGHAYFFPIGDTAVHEGNLSDVMCDYLDRLDPGKTVSRRERSLLVWNHVLALGYSSLSTNAEGGWARIPFPAVDADVEGENGLARLRASAALGQRVADLLDVRRDVEGVTSGELRPELAAIAELHGHDENGNTVITVPWGRRDKIDRVVLNHGRVNRHVYTTEEWRALETGARGLGTTADGDRLPRLHAGAVYAALGETTVDVYLDDKAYWSNIPERVWEYIIGGYPVLKKWLSHRCRGTLGRGLSPEELAHFPKMARRLAALRLLEPALNLNYAHLRDRTEAFK